MMLNRLNKKFVTVVVSFLLLTMFQSNTFADEDAVEKDEAAEGHLGLFVGNRFPSANECKSCHPKHYKEWSVSQHAYAQLSPVYMAMQKTINAVTSSTNGDFCIRCHTPVGMNLEETPFMANLDRHPTSREGVTCIVCHRMNLEYGKVSGRVALLEGDLQKPVFGPKGNKNLQQALDDHPFSLKEGESGRKVHLKAGHFPRISDSGFCGVCHDVNLFNGFRLEEAFAEYKNSPAAKEGISCQDCHMGKIQGKKSGYEEGPAAYLGDDSSKPTAPRKLTNHYFAGPDHSIIHPGIFPHNEEAVEIATLKEWLLFDYKAGWGTDEFEDSVEDDAEFPEVWDSVDARYEAREVLDQQFELLEWAKEKRVEVLKNGFAHGDIKVVEATEKDGIKIEVEVKNITNGHNVPTGFDAERVIWLQTTITNQEGKIIFKSGDLDPNGDVRDAHSLYVHNGEIPLDSQLLNLQSKFLTRNVRGGEREQVLPINFSLDPLPFVRPSTRSTILTGQPFGARKHRMTIPPLATRIHNYKVDSELLTGAGEYTLKIAMKVGMVPINLIDAIKGVGFDYGMSTREIADGIRDGHTTVWETETKIQVQSAK
ncbi:MAG: multiheme c-type cytochrome [Methylococcaceae bacterium]